ncbi:MAG: M6 family metalloprotease domain-containing protein [Candidatus Eisenbacteria bacterium]|uniref:M6 family metalloprotease domain-containing protein n=1 Tax=Eiseniibacteriota bacterium TaxID=2212470 RepID=A0A933WAD1_UNCEI|nr:M6 family metalloprotease domain-containing protein [Candidatus Eisenbacteria bacterium]
MPPARSGGLPAPLSAARESGLLDVPVLPEFPTSAQANDWLVPVVLVGFTDSTLRWSAPQLQHALFDTTRSTATGSVVDYFDWASRGRARVRFEIVATVQLGHDLNYYANDRYGVDWLSTPNNDWGLVRDAVVAADPHVDWRRFDRDGDSYVDMIWVVHAGIGGEGASSMRSLWSITSRLSGGWSDGGVIETDELVPGSDRQHMRVDRFSILPELSMFVPGAISEIGVYCHEFGHALGLPDLYDTSQLGGSANVGPGNWSLMSTGAYGGDGHSPQYPSHPGAWPSLYLGWAEKVRPANDTLLTLAPLADGGGVVEVWFQGESSSEHFLLESRATSGFDHTLPAPGLIVSQVDDALIGIRLGSNRVNTGPTPGLRILEGDGDFDLATSWNHGDANDPLPGALGRTRLDDDTSPNLRSIGGAITQIALENIATVNGRTQVRLRVRAPGWRSVEEVPDPANAPVAGGSRGRTAVVTPQGTEYSVSSDSRGGSPQVLLRTRSLDGVWSEPQIVTQSPSAAFEPTIALLPNNDLALAWTDLRGGQFQIWYRARIGGWWTAERPLTSAPDGCVSPAIATDGRGRVFVAWIKLHNPRPSLQFLAFGWASPFGTPATASDTTDFPSAPAIAATPDGRAMVAWSDLAGTQPRVQFARWSPDSGLSPRLRLTSSAAYSQPACDLAAGADGTFHLVWQQQTSGLSEIHYQRRPTVGSPSPRDTVLAGSGDALQSPGIVTDPLGGVHLLFERTTPSGQQLNYKRWVAGRGWDKGASTLSGSEGSVSHATLTAITPGGVNVTYQSSDALGDHLVTRLRRLDGRAAADVPEPPAPTLARSALSIAPNPAFAGTVLRLRGAEFAPGAAADLLDAAGRRLATAHADGTGELRFGAEVTRALAPGLYFARPRAGGPAARLVVIR